MLGHERATTLPDRSRLASRGLDWVVDDAAGSGYLPGVAHPGVVVNATARMLHYALEGQLGEGGMGVVYRAVDTRLDRPVALKFLPEALSLSPDAKQRLLLEAKAAANLDHPNIGVIHGIEEAEGRVFIVMALYQGQTLQERLSRGPCGPTDAIDWCLQAARGLAKAHAAGIVHRDIKPANLFLTQEGLLKILDFGLVKLDQTSGLTMPGTLIGTPEYMAPEQVRGQGVDARADVWGLGVVLYEALTGTSPFHDEGGIAATILRVMSSEPAPLAEVAPEVPTRLQPVIDRALAKDSDLRFGSVQDFAAELERVLDDIAGSRRDAATGASASATPTLDATAGPAAAGGSTATPSIANLTLAGRGSLQRNALLEPVPLVPRFVGRERELDELRARLERARMVAIRGMAGEGKSAVGARLVRDLYPEERVCWFTFDPIEKNTVDALYWSVAAFLAAAGEPLLWKYLQGEIEAHRPLDRTVRMNLFLTSLAANDFAFCFDEVHLVAHDPEVGELFKALKRHFAGGAQDVMSAFVVMGRDLPSDLEHTAITLAGLTRSDLDALLADRGASLPEPLVARLHERTHGNPTLLELAVSALERMGDDHDAMASFVESMAGRSDVRDYVMNHIYADLAPDEQAILDALSIFGGAVEREVAEETLTEGGLQGIARSVAILVQKAIVQETESGKLYCHDLVREFCYRNLDTRARRSLHAHAARYYEGLKNPLRAAHHTFEHGDHAHAFELLTTHRKTIIESGGATSLLDQFARFDPRDLGEEQQLALVLAKGDALMVRGAFKQALELYEFALEDVFEEEARAELLTRMGSVCNELGEHERAIGYVGEALAAFEAAGLPAGGARAQRVLGAALVRLGRLDEAASAYAAGLSLAEAAGDVGLAAYFDQYLGAVDLRQDRLERARERLERSRRSFRAQRDRIGEAEALGNLAMVYGLLGQHDRQMSLLTKTLEIMEEVGDVGILLILRNNLGYQEHLAGRYEAAIEHRELLVALARRIGHPLWEGAGLVGWAEDLLALGRVSEAGERAVAAHELLRELPSAEGTCVELAMSERVLGEVRLASGEFDEARALFEASIPTFEAAHEIDELAKARRGLDAARASSAGESPAETELAHDHV